MAENDRPLPTPPRTRFGRQIRGEEEGAGPLTADRLTQAAAEGRLEEVLQHEIPEGEHARSLAMMMLGMSGMMPPGMPGLPEQSLPGASPEASADLPEPATGASPGASALPGALDETAAAVPPAVLAAMMQGDVAGLASLLRAEHARRQGERPPEVDAVAAQPLSASAGDGAARSAVDAAGAPQAGIDKALVDELIRVAAENQVTVDWLVLRAVKLYVEEHRRTGRL